MYTTYHFRVHRHDTSGENSTSESVAKGWDVSRAAWKEYVKGSCDTTSPVSVGCTGTYCSPLADMDCTLARCVVCPAFLAVLYGPGCSFAVPYGFAVAGFWLGVLEGYVFWAPGVFGKGIQCVVDRHVVGVQHQGTHSVKKEGLGEREKSADRIWERWGGHSKQASSNTGDW